MGLYNFQMRFAPFILAGTKTHTIRAMRKHPDVPGNTLHLYTGLRSKQATLLMRAKCVRVENISIRMQLHSGDSTLARGIAFPKIFIEGEELSWDETQAFARRDGFVDFAEMLVFWRYPKNRIPFQGHIIHWKAL